MPQRGPLVGVECAGGAITTWAGARCDEGGSVVACGDRALDPAWRMPLDDEYKEIIKSGIADIVNSGGRWGGAVNAAMFLKEFAEDTPWLHLDIAGTAMGAPKTDINHSWGSGYGVRLLDRLVSEYYEATK